MNENYFLTLWNFTYLKDTSFGKKLCKFEHGLETKKEFEKWPLITFFQCTQTLGLRGYSFHAYVILMPYKRIIIASLELRRRMLICFLVREYIHNTFYVTNLTDLP